MSRRKKSLWPKALQRNLDALGWRVVRAGRRVLSGAVGAVARPRARAERPDDWIGGSAMASGALRCWWLYRPPGQPVGQRLPLMVMLHGCGQDAKGFADCTRMNRVAAREGFFVLYVEQDRMANPQRCWNWFALRSAQALGEGLAVLAAIDQVLLKYPVDGARVALVGLSAGGSMAALIATLHPARFAAVVMHSGVPPGVARTASEALAAMRGRRPPAPLPADDAVTAGLPWPPLLVIHGVGDTVVEPGNGRAAVEFWARHASARARPARAVQRGQRHAATLTEFVCGRRLVASLCEVASLGHAWSGGAAGQPHADPRGPDASRMAWTFAAKQFEAARSGGLWPRLSRPAG